MEILQPVAMAALKAHYSPGIKHDGVIYVSGQLPLDTDGKLSGETVSEQTRRCLKHISTILAEGNSSLSQVLKLNVFVSDIVFWPDVNAVVAEVFGDHKPARIVVPSGRLNYGCLVEIDAVAFSA